MSDRPNGNHLAKLEGLLLTEVTTPFDPRTLFWFGLSVAFAIAFGGRALQQAFTSEYILQDDWRHHVFWMARFLDPDLFPRDLLADYFQSVAPVGYATLYRAAAGVGLDPFLFAKLLPMALGLITTIFCFGASMRILRVPAAAFIGSLVLNQSLWMRNGLVSATPRAFIAPLFLAFIYFFLSRRALLVLASIALMGLFFPSTMFIALGSVLLQIFRLEARRIRFSRERRDYVLSAASLAVAALVLLPYAFRSSAFGPVVTANEARLLPEFLPGGRMVVFRQDFWGRWITGNHTGMFTSAVFSPFTICLGLLLPALMLLGKRVPLATRISNAATLFPRVIIASLALFFAANALLFRLYLPSRFTTNSFRIVLAIASGITAVVLLDGLFRAVRSPTALVAGALLIAGALLLPFATGTVVDTRYKTGTNAGLYEYLTSQPKSVLIASLSDEANNLPIFTKRSVLVSRETALPFHKAYYSQVRDRVIDLIDAQYSADISELTSFIEKYGVTYLLVDRDAFSPEYLSRDKWIAQYQPATKEAVARLKQGVRPALSGLMETCSVYETEDMVLISAARVTAARAGHASESVDLVISDADHLAQRGPGEHSIGKRKMARRRSPIEASRR
ncbi:MAG TPA: hypothetical protein VLM38_21730 [Blastocatellia bacterium]|nr:hypothetical protein [Blastocatellia bacterium]